jgi:Cu2+-exporting ATPase
MAYLAPETSTPAEEITQRFVNAAMWMIPSPARSRSKQILRQFHKEHPPTRSKLLRQWFKTGETTPSTDAKLAKRKAQAQQLFLMTTGSLLFSSLGALGVPVFYWLGGIFLTVLAVPVCLLGLRDLSRGNININVLYLVVMGGMVVTGNFWAGNFSMFIYAIAEKLTLFATDTSQKELIDVFKIHPDFVYVVCDGAEIRRPFNTLQPGDVVAVHAGEMIPADGKVVAGMATVDQHVLTGEAQPVEKEPGQPVFATTVLLSGWVHLTVEKAGSETIAARIGQILNDTTDFKSTVQMRSQKLSDQSVLPTLILGAVSLPIVGVNGALAVVSAHFKAKMNATAPLSALNYFKQSSKQGILFKDGRSLDLLHGVDTIVFDKTGTLTQEEPEVWQIHRFETDLTEQTILQYAASAEAKQTHPIARAILSAARQQLLEPLPIDDAQYKVGYGLQVVLQGQVVRVGSFRFMEMEQLPISAEILEQAGQASQQTHTLVLVAIGPKVVGGIELAAALRPEAIQVVHQLRQLPQIKTLYIISGDNEAATCQLAQKLGIDHYFAETLPQHKAELIEQLQQEGRSICYIGDGINDSIALRKAQVSVSLRGASTVAIDTAQIVLMDGHLQQLPVLFEIAQDFRRNINWMFAVTIAPMLVGIGSVFLFHFGLIHILIINKIGLVGAVGVAMLPAWQPLPSPASPLLQTDPTHHELNSN